MKFMSLRISGTSLSYKAECDHNVCLVFFSSSFFYFLNLVFSPSSSPAPKLALSLQWGQILLVPYSPDSCCSSGHEVHEAEHKFLALSGPAGSCHGKAEDLPASCHFTLSNLEPVMGIAKALNGIRLLHYN